MVPVVLSGRSRVAAVIFMSLVPLLHACSDSGGTSVADLTNPPEETDNTGTPGVDPVVDPIVDPIVDPVVDPVVDPLVDPVVDPVVDPIVDPVVTENTARYRLVFEAGWSSASHSLNFPGGPHFSGLVGAVHNEQVIFWERGQLASDGIEVMAETGSKASLRPEVDSAIAEGHALSLIDDAGIAVSPGSVSIEFEVNQDYPQLTVVSMLAPSPDWFVGVQNLDLRQGNGFVESLTVDLALYDAGTDSGLRYGSSNDDTDPPDTITRLSSESADTPFTNGEPLVGQFVFTKLSQ